MAHALLRHIADTGATPAKLTVEWLRNGTVTYQSILNDVQSHAVNEILDVLKKSDMEEKVVSWAKTKYASEVAALSKVEAGLHFQSLKTTEKKLREFEMDGVAKKMSTDAPRVWDLLDCLLSADTQLSVRRERRKVPKGSRNREQEYFSCTRFGTSYYILPLVDAQRDLDL
ncbi:hypothetical protein H0H92_002245 [Tricholoma furcatifolium]|nr:hypothetical protein H0H92_002245 [Tricholoma furcatifolium]